MENQAEYVRSEMNETRENLTDKLEKLEERFSESVAAAQDSVTSTMETVKEGVEETVDSVRSALDIPAHVRAHPWLMMGGGVLVGYLAYQMLVPARRTSGGRSWSGGSSAEGNGGGGWGSWLPGSGTLGSGWQNLQRYAARTALDLVGRTARETLPGELGTSIGNTVDKMTAKLNDEPATASASRPM